MNDGATTYRGRSLSSVSRLRRVEPEYCTLTRLSSQLGFFLFRRSSNPKSNAGAPVVLKRRSRRRGETPGRGANRRWRVAPISAAEHVMRARRRAIHDGQVARQIERDCVLIRRSICWQSRIGKGGCEAILHPLHDIAIHVVQTELIRWESTRRRSTYPPIRARCLARAACSAP